jgi:uncharacterized protein
MLKRIVPLLLGVFGIFNTASAQKSLLWKVSGNGLGKPSYIFGTMHMICPTDYFMSNSVKSAFKSAESIYMEMDMDDPMMMIRVGQLAQLPEGESLERIFTEKEYSDLSKYFKEKLNMDLKLFNGFKPFLLQTLIAKGYFKCETPASYEMDFAQMAKEQQKDVKGLETPEDQVGVFDSMPDKEEVKMIMETVYNPQEQIDDFNKMVALYKKQDIAGLYKLMETSKKADGFEKELLEKRNNNWVPIIRKVMAQKSTFFAVGALHLPGPQGVLTQLKKAGYTVTPVL